MIGLATRARLAGQGPLGQLRVPLGPLMLPGVVALPAPETTAPQPGAGAGPGSQPGDGSTRAGLLSGNMKWVLLAAVVGGAAWLVTKGRKKAEPSSTPVPPDEKTSSAPSAKVDRSPASGARRASDCGCGCGGSGGCGTREAREQPETIALIKGCGWMKLESCVGKVFRDRESAHKWENSQHENVTIRVLPGKWKVGQTVPLGSAGKPLSASERRRDSERELSFAGYSFTAGPKGTAIHRGRVRTRTSGDHGADPIGDGMFRMVPSGDVVDYEERNRRMAAHRGSERAHDENNLHSRIAAVLGWSIDDVQSMGLRSLRDLVRQAVGESHALVAEINDRILHWASEGAPDLGDEALEAARARARREVELTNKRQMIWRTTLGYRVRPMGEKMNPAIRPEIVETVPGDTPRGSVGSVGERRRKPWSRLPAGWTKDSLEDFWDSVGGRVRTCITKIEGRVDDPGAFCASIADRLEPGWRSRETSRRGPMPTVEWDGRIYSLKSRTMSPPDLGAMSRIGALVWLNRNTYPRGYSRGGNPLAGMAGVVNVRVREEELS